MGFKNYMLSPLLKYMRFELTSTLCKQPLLKYMLFELSSTLCKLPLLKYTTENAKK